MLQSRLKPRPRTTPLGTSHQHVSTPDFTSNDQQIDDESPEDIFGSFLAHLLPDDAPSFHGDAGQHLLYSSPRHGVLDIMVPSYPGSSDNRSEEIDAGGTTQVEAGRKLFAHFLWSAGLVVAEGVESASEGDSESIWSVEGETVMELGAGVYFSTFVEWQKIDKHFQAPPSHL